VHAVHDEAVLVPVHGEHALDAEEVLVPRVDQPLQPRLQQRKHHGRALQADAADGVAAVQRGEHRGSEQRRLPSRGGERPQVEQLLERHLVGAGARVAPGWC